MKKPQRREPNTSHLAGEYFVAAELSKRGWAVAMTLGNAKCIDLFVEKDRRTANIQVKAISHKRNAGWPIWRSKVWSNVIYVFVCLNSENEAPTYYIGTPKEIRHRINEYRTRSILNIGKVRSGQFLNRWDKIEKAVNSARAAVT